MEEKFDVTQDGQGVGTVEVKREGLYCRISCRCQRYDDEIHRLYAGNEKIGVLIPEGGELVLETRVAAKRIQDGCAFFLNGNGGDFIPIRPGEVFEHLDKLRLGRLGLKDGVYGLIL